MESAQISLEYANPASVGVKISYDYSDFKNDDPSTDPIYMETGVYELAPDGISLIPVTIPFLDSHIIEDTKNTINPELSKIGNGNYFSINKIYIFKFEVWNNIFKESLIDEGSLNFQISTPASDTQFYALESFNISKLSSFSLLRTSSYSNESTLILIGNDGQYITYTGSFENKSDIKIKSFEYSDYFGTQFLMFGKWTEKNFNIKDGVQNAPQ